MGSDTSSYSCYNSTIEGKEILEKLTSLNLDRSSQESFYFLWQDFVEKASSLVENIYKSFYKKQQVFKLHVWGGIFMLLLSL